LGFSRNTHKLRGALKAPIQSMSRIATLTSFQDDRTLV